MKVYFGMKKVNAERIQFGLTVYSDVGKILHTSTTFADVAELRYDNPLNLMFWGIKKLKVLLQNKALNESEDMIFFITSKPLYTWFENEVAPKPYIVRFADLQLELSFILNTIEIIFNKYSDKKVLFENKSKEVYSKVTDTLR